MKIHRFIGDFDLSQKPARPHDISGAGWELEIKDKEIINQIKNVLKLKVDEFVDLSDGKNSNALAKIKKLEKNSILVEIEKIEENKKIKNDITLFCAILKKENFELVVQKTTECGISKIVPIISERTIKTGLNQDRLKKIAKEASEQSGRNNIPEILEPITFEEALKLIKEKDFNILFDSSGEYSFKIHAYSPAGELLCSPRQSAQCISNEHSPSQKNTQTNIWIGPEGGWTEKEITKAKALNFQIASLGPLTLRGETAAIIASYLVSNLC